MGVSPSLKDPKLVQQARSSLFCSPMAMAKICLITRLMVTCGPLLIAFECRSWLLETTCCVGAGTRSRIHKSGLIALTSPLYLGTSSCECCLINLFACVHFVLYSKLQVYPFLTHCVEQQFQSDPCSPVEGMTCSLE